MITVTRLDSGFYMIRGTGPCNWAQTPLWPCSEKTIRDHAFPEASEGFLHEAIRSANAALEEKR